MGRVKQLRPTVSPPSVAAPTAAGESARLRTDAEILAGVPEPPRRVRRLLDLVRLALAAAGLVLAVLVARVAANTVAGIGADLGAATGAVPRTAVVVVAALAAAL